MEASWVFGLRALALASGRSSAGELARMVTEKLDAAVASQGIATAALLAGTPEAVVPDVVAFYRRKVAANRRRLARRM